MTGDKSLDILIPHFNDVDGLELSLQSVQQQIWPHGVRVVIADDGSRREDFHKLERVVDSFDINITVLRNEENRGRPYTRNVLLYHVNNPLLTWLDAGDEWLYNKNLLQLKELDSNRCANSMYWVTCDYYWKWENKKPIHCRQTVDGDQVKKLLAGRELRAYLWTILAPASSFKEVGFFDEKLPRLQDLDYFLRFVAAGGKIVSPTSDDPLCVYHKSDVGRSAQQIRECNKYIFKKHFDLYFRYGEEFIKSRKYDMDLLSARYAFNNKDHISAYYYLLNALLRRPRTLVKRVYSKGLRV